MAENKQGLSKWWWLACVLLIFGALILVARVSLSEMELAEEIVDRPLHDSLGLGEGDVFSKPPQEVADAFIAASDENERLKWVRNPEAVAGRISDYPVQALNTPVVKLKRLGLATNGNDIFARFAARFADGSSRLVCVLSTPGGPRVDWDCYARYGTASWPQIFNYEVSSAEVRVFAKSDHYYNDYFRDDTQWACFKLSSPELDDGRLVYGYVRRGTRTCKILKQALPVGKRRSQRVMLRVSSPVREKASGEKVHQFRIDRVINIGWIRGERDLEDSWQPRVRRRR